MKTIAHNCLLVYIDDCRYGPLWHALLTRLTRLRMVGKEEMAGTAPRAVRATTGYRPL